MTQEKETLVRTGHEEGEGWYVEFHCGVQWNRLYQFDENSAKSLVGPLRRYKALDWINEPDDTTPENLLFSSFLRLTDVAVESFTLAERKRFLWQCIREAAHILGVAEGYIDVG